MKILKPGTEWDSTLAKLSAKDIYFTGEYHVSFEKSMQRVARAFVYEEGANIFFYPFMLSRISKIGNIDLSQKYYDIETVYGYTGPLTNYDDTVFLQKACDGFYQYCEGGNIICEMVRYNPLLKNDRYIGKKTQKIFNRHTIAIELGNPENLWTGYHPKLRNDLKRCEKLGLQFSQNSVGAEEFKELYAATMRRIKATDFYIFDSSHFKYCQGNMHIFSVRENGEILAAAIILTYGEFMHYHLAASADSPNQAYAGKYLIHKAAEWGINNGYKIFHLGGGRTTADDDNLLFFKKRFGTLVNDFYIGKTIFKQADYEELCNKWRMQGGMAPAGFLQCYRLPIS